MKRHKNPSSDRSILKMCLKFFHRPQQLCKFHRLFLFLLRLLSSTQYWPFATTAISNVLSICHLPFATHSSDSTPGLTHFCSTFITRTVSYLMSTKRSSWIYLSINPLYLYGAEEYPNEWIKGESSQVPGIKRNYGSGIFEYPRKSAENVRKLSLHFSTEAQRIYSFRKHHLCWRK